MSDDFLAVLAAYGPALVIHAVVTTDPTYPYHGGMPVGTLCGLRLRASRNKFSHIRARLRCGKCERAFTKLTEVGAPRQVR